MTAAVVVAVIFFLLATLPPLPRGVATTIDPDVQKRTIAGAYHIHSTRSDGAADKDTIAEAASRAGLAFIILTDHGDGMRRPDAPAYLHGVLCIDAVEISTNGGHYVALDMQPSPYPLGGEPSAVVEDVKRLGGFGIAAHPDSPRRQLAWTDWGAEFDGIEWLSADSEWRDESRARLAKVLFDYLWRPGPALASVLDRPVATLQHWDALTAHRPVVALAAVDAHGGIGRGMEEGGKRRSALGHIPSYEASFRTFSTRAVLDRALAGDAAADARELIHAIRSGSVFTVIDALASPGYIDFTAHDSVSKGKMGSVFRSSGGSSSVDVTMPPGGRLFLSQGGQEFEPPSDGHPGHWASATDNMRGAVRFEVRVPGAPGTPPVPWLVSNPVYFLPTPASLVRPPSDAAASPFPADAVWHVEKDPHSTATTSVSGGQMTLDYRLGDGARNSQFAAAVVDLRGRALKFTTLIFSATAIHPARMSVQLRYSPGGGERWARSVYVDPNARETRVSVDSLVPVDSQSGPAPDTSTADSLLFVVDLTNARPGDANAVTISNLRFVR